LRFYIKSVSIGIVNSSSLLTVDCSLFTVNSQPSTVNRQHHSGVTGNDIRQGLRTPHSHQPGFLAGARAATKSFRITRLMRPGLLDFRFYIDT